MSMKAVKKEEDRQRIILRHTLTAALKISELRFNTDNFKDPIKNAFGRATPPIVRDIRCCRISERPKRSERTLVKIKENVSDI